MRIYKITNIITGKFYIGKTIRSLDERFYHHKYAAKNQDKKTHLMSSMNKYGHDNFIIEELCTATNENELSSLEIEYISKLKPYYNKAPGGKGGRNKGFYLSEEHKIKISSSLKGKHKSEKHIKNASYSRSKSWKFLDPNNNLIEIRNLSEYCRQNNLNQSHMTSVHNCRYGYNSHKGYTKA